MSSDTAKENASVVDSSLTEWKHDMGNLDDPGNDLMKKHKSHLSDGCDVWRLESPTYKGTEVGYPFGAEKAGFRRVENSAVSKKGKLYNTRYFIIKSLNHQNIQRSIEKGIWATQVMNEPILEEAFHNSGKVILIFSVNMSGFFQGYAQMISSVGWRRDNVWSQGSGKNNPWGRSFRVKWLRLSDLPFQKTLHLKNPLNEYKPVKISRDCQELPEDIGEALCELIDGESTSFPMDDLPPKQPYVEPPCSLGDGDCNSHPLHMPWASTCVPYPSFIYQQNSDGSGFHLAHQGPNGVTFRENKLSRMKHSHINGSVSNLQLQPDVPPRRDVWGLSVESPLASTLTDDDFLEMTYEDYLEVHGRSIKQLNFPAAGPSRTAREPSRSRRDDNSKSSSASESSCLWKRARQ